MVPRLGGIALSSRDLVFTALLTALTVVGALLTFNLPFVTSVPFTLQVLAVLLAGLLLGPARGALSQGLYLFLGALGLPVFHGLTGGIGLLVGPTGGYLLGYPLAAAVAGLGRGRGWGLQVLSALGGLIVVYGAGWVGLRFFAHLPWDRAFWAGVVPFLPYDAVKAVLAALIAQRLYRSVA